ncbi:helix-turn-helix domain-containing protein [Novosphingobium sp. PhB165]|uniref:helix-turn-helix domain-containing protein n=1 Tax=Novosphingobium sp. PhB165 TaxID=2485105 RepID=UPI0010439F87|nr:helix-turn-helix domain-containing protein [Novosphingobium sp. PhB165]
MSGFIAMDRGALDHPLLKDAERFRAWFWIVARARWQPAPFDVGGKMITLERGQLSYSIRELADQWGWSKSTVDRFLKRLEAEGMVNLTRAKTGTARGTSVGTDRLVINVCNYGKYQDFNPQAGTASEPENGTELGQKRDIKEQGNKGTKDIPSPIGDGRDAPEPLALDLAGAIFRTGLKLLMASGHKEPAARSIIGRWRKTYSDGTVLAVLARCQTAQPAPSSPIEWITKALQAEQQRAAGQAPQPQHQTEERASVREIGMDLAARKRRERVEQEERIAIGAR